MRLGGIERGIEYIRQLVGNVKCRNYELINRKAQDRSEWGLLQSAPDRQKKKKNIKHMLQNYRMYSI